MLRLVAFRFYGKQPASLPISSVLPLVSLALPWILIRSVVVVAISMQAQLQLEAKLNLCASRNFLQIVHCCSALLIGWVVTHCQLPYLRLHNLPLASPPAVWPTWAELIRKVEQKHHSVKVLISFCIIISHGTKTFVRPGKTILGPIVDTWLTARMGIRTGGREPENS